MPDILKHEDRAVIDHGCQIRCLFGRRYRVFVTPDDDRLQRKSIIAFPSSAQCTLWNNDKERRFALGLEFDAKAQYADIIKAAVATLEPDALRLRMIVTNVDAQTLRRIPDITIVDERGSSFEIETPRYRQLTELLLRLAKDGADVAILSQSAVSITVQSDQTGLGLALYRAGALLVLPAGLVGCLPLNVPDLPTA